MIKQLVLFCVLLVCGRAAGLAATMEELFKTIAEGEGRPVYEAFKALPESADTPEKQRKVFAKLFPYLGQPTNYCIVRNYYPQGYRSTQKSFSYAEMAASAIAGLGETGRRSLVDSLTSQPSMAVEHAAVMLCRFEESAIYMKSQPEEKSYRGLEAAERKALETFLKQQGHTLMVDSLTRFVRGGFSNAVEYIHSRLKTTQDLMEKKHAAFWLGTYGYAPALDDLLKILREHPDAHLRQVVARELEHFADVKRTTQALEEALSREKDEQMCDICRIALGVIHSKQELKK